MCLEECHQVQMMWLHGFNISLSNIIDNSACNLYHVQKCKILCFVLFMDVQSKKCWSAFYFIESIQSIPMMWCDANQFFSSKDTETSYQQFLPLSCQLNIDNSLDIVCVHNLKSSKTQSTLKRIFLYSAGNAPSYYKWKQNWQLELFITTLCIL